MKKSRTGSPAREALASPPVATVQLPLPLLDVPPQSHCILSYLCFLFFHFSHRLKNHANLAT